MGSPFVLSSLWGKRHSYDQETKTFSRDICTEYCNFFSFLSSFFPSLTLFFLFPFLPFSISSSIFFFLSFFPFYFSLFFFLHPISFSFYIVFFSFYHFFSFLLASLSIFLLSSIFSLITPLRFYFYVFLSNIVFLPSFLLLSRFTTPTCQVRQSRSNPAINAT